MESALSQKAATNQPFKFVKEMMQNRLVFDSDTTLERGPVESGAKKSSSACLMPALSKSCDPQQNIHITQIDVLNGDKDGGDFNAFFGLTSEKNLDMLSKECSF